MQAQVTELKKLLEGTHQYVVPLYQREYSWTRKEWQQIWFDIVELAENTEPHSHFIGSMVTMPSKSVPQGVAKYVLIDGQQRLTTLFVLLASIRDHARSSIERLADRIDDQLLTNKYNEGSDAQKLMPTQVDREAFLSAMLGETPRGDGALQQARRYFIRKLSESGTPPLERLVATILDDLLVVSIVLDGQDDPYLIFESLNAKGRPLTQADLIRNYFLMKVDLSIQERLYHELWLPMQRRLGEDLAEFIRHFLTMRGAVVRQADLYYELKDRTDGLTPNEIEEYVRDLESASKHYSKLLRPQEESDSRLRDRLDGLKRLEVTVAYPFVLSLYRELDRELITVVEFVNALAVLENFLVRRFVCDIRTTGLNKEFPLLYGQASQADDLVDGVKTALQTKRYPRDAEFRDRLINIKLYGRGNRLATTRLILERLDASFEHREKVDVTGLTIEHLMPQTLTQWWRDHLGGDWEVTHETLLDTLGNLTLTAYNGPLSNDDWDHKRAILEKSHIELSRSLHGVARWDESAIKSRAEMLADRALAIWPYFGLSQDDVDSNNARVTGKKPLAVTILDQRFAVETWRDVAERTMETLIDLDEENFTKVMQRYSRMLARDTSFMRSPRELSNGVYMETHLSADALYRFCLQAAEVADLSADDWRVEFRR